MRWLLIPILAGMYMLPAIGADPTLDPVDARVLTEFKAFAEKEVEQEKNGFRRYIQDFIVEPKGTHFLFSKHVFQGYKVEAVPNVWNFDVRKTNSIVSPYTGVIEFPVIFILETVWAKGDREFCEGQSLKTCLDHEGELYEGAGPYKHTLTRIPQKVEREYVYQDNIWTPKMDFDLLMAGLVALLESKRPMPSMPPTIFGRPWPILPLPPPPPPTDTTSS